VIEDAAIAATDGEAFDGHVGGDDFVIVVQPEQAPPVAEAIVAAFDGKVGEWYDAGDRANGYIEVMNRRGELQRFSVLTISIGVATTEKRTFHHYAEAVAIATEMKQYAKGLQGSAWAADRRTD
jgi:GGDEF domain-containing protein